MNNEEKILEMLVDLKAGQDRMETRMDGLEASVGELNRRVGGLEQRIGSLEERVDGLDQRMGSLEERMDGLDQRMGSLEERMDGLETYSRQTRVLLEKQEHNIRLIAEQHTDIVKKLDKLNDRAAQIDDVRERVQVLENVVMDHTAAIKELRELRKAE
ncbi:MAG: hypothetical protein HDT27_10760 [Subdoligranulum sp.]|nr:hypothetical protein [Subdoligranulum sp.]MBD5103142.1 hypothetical protein [Subdoligranulum sp.]